MGTREQALELLRAFQALPPDRQCFLLGYAQGMARLHPGWLDYPEDRPQRRDLRLGDRVLVYPNWGGAPRRSLGTVAYIHPEKRYYEVALDRGGRQAFRWGFAD